MSNPKDRITKHSDLVFSLILNKMSLDKHNIVISV